MGTCGVVRVVLGGRSGRGLEGGDLVEVLRPGMADSFGAKGRGVCCEWFTHSLALGVPEVRSGARGLYKRSAHRFFARELGT